MSYVIPNTKNIMITLNEDDKGHPIEELPIDAWLVHDGHPNAGVTMEPMVPAPIGVTMSVPLSEYLKYRPDIDASKVRRRDQFWSLNTESWV
jgi:hypothetical protein